MKKLALATSCLIALAASAQAQVANISTTDLTPAGYVSVSMTTAPSPTYFTNDGDTFIAVQQTGAAKTGSIRTAATQVTAQGYGAITLADQTLTIPSGTGVVYAGPFPTGRWNNPAYNTVKVDWSAPVSASVIRLPQ